MRVIIRTKTKSIKAHAIPAETSATRILADLFAPRVARYAITGTAINNAQQQRLRAMSFMLKFYPPGGSVWRRDFRWRMSQSTPIVAAMDSGPQSATRAANSEAFGGRRMIHPSAVMNVTLIRLATVQTTAKTVVQISSDASENCSSIVDVHQSQFLGFRRHITTPSTSIKMPNTR
jgi:hypothetical protein